MQHREFNVIVECMKNEAEPQQGKRNAQNSLFFGQKKERKQQTLAIGKHLAQIFQHSS